MKIKKIDSIRELIDLLNSQSFLLKNGNVYKLSASSF